MTSRNMTSRANVTRDDVKGGAGLLEVNDDAGDVDNGDAEQHTADARTPLDAHVLLTGCIRK